MAKELVFLQIGEYRSPENFLGKIDLLIQYPLNEKTTVLTVLALLEENLDRAGIEDEVLDKHVEENYPDIKNGDLFMDHHGFKPEPGIRLYAIFDLKTISD
ncbi:hypothetical protein [Dyadobacter sp. CY312]|uniref:hypothetical protein n=1 Tax=Dyadobacter sp. CY312 TaxID=2907303 RepID=UPI001F3BC288|nr:hypothetical protein [Dyadobacter sp. CY312]MCE7039177.1 hypothetical protein [Dyadobacter sp. CY312]